MRNRILNYSQKIRTLITEDKADTDWNRVLNDLLIQISFFQHERLIHLLVTITFALLEIISIALCLFCNTIMTILLSLLILCLLIPYIRHYYLLENEVQRMYTYYDRILEKIK
ncbi:MAG: hypothetical protein PUF12_06430 [Thermoflexaceae bacterium]|nr:hypothetical protein [Thermoflexaceae bacterium]